MSLDDVNDKKTHNLRQRQYFEGVHKKTMVPVESNYLHRHIEQVLRFVELTSKDRVIEVGCGMGRYTMLLAEYGVNVTGLDLSRVLLGRLGEYSAGRFEIPLIAAELEHPPIKLHDGFDVVMGFFMLHHLHNLSSGLTGVCQLLKPGGRVVFLEPNPFNPLYYLQILLTPGMTWADERGMLRMRPEIVFQAMREAGLESHAYFHFGCLPPQIVNQRWGAMLEGICEIFPVLRGLRPFTLFKGQLH
ncbi:MAG: methyltransferase domain-containing protein [Anaerolineales bacterium]|nr:methyltransferase domain-containing protein [Anaerolineales bacterium]